jgi:hypothetical protein
MNFTNWKKFTTTFSKASHSEWFGKILQQLCFTLFTTVQCKKIYFSVATRRVTDSLSSPIAAFLASNLLTQFFSFSRQKIIQIPYMALKKDGNLAVRLL